MAIRASGISSWLWCDGVYQELPEPHRRPLAEGINDQDQVVGARKSDLVEPEYEGEIVEPQFEAFCAHGDRIVVLHPASGCESFAFAINRHGQVAGVARTEAGLRRAVLWSAGGMVDLDAAWPERSSVATCLSDGGPVAGNAEWDGLRRATLWADGTAIDLGALPGAQISHASGINDCRWVVGHSGPVESQQVGQHRPFIWRDGRMRELPNPGGGTGNALGINDAGQVVGTITNEAGQQHAALWEGDELFDLNQVAPQRSGWVLEEAVAINNLGWIIGNGRRAVPDPTVPGDVVDYQQLGFLLIPE
jgi:probable HAF family extracellular repeat protein